MTERPAADVRPRWRDVEVITDLVPRTDVERWQMQDRIGAVLGAAGVMAGPAAFHLRGARIVFRARWARGRRDALLRLLREAPWR